MTTEVPAGPELDRLVADRLRWRIEPLETDYRTQQYIWLDGNGSSWGYSWSEGETPEPLPAWSTDPAAAVMLVIEHRLVVFPIRDDEEIGRWLVRELDPFNPVFNTFNVGFGATLPEAVARCVVAMMEAKQ